MSTTGSADWANSLIWGDNKYILASLIAGDPAIGLEPLAGKVDLIYIDPPFASGQDFSYQVRVGDETWRKEANLIEEKAYRDMWGGWMSTYIPTMYERLVLAMELLSPDGSIYVHCDPTASHYLKLILDQMLGHENFQNELVWKRTSTKSLGNTRYARNGDRLLYYTKSDKGTWNQLHEEYSDEYINSNYRNEDEHGRWATADLTGGKAGGAESYMPLRGVKPPTGRAWAPPTLSKIPASAHRLLPSNYESLSQIEKCEALDDARLLHWSEAGKPYAKKYLSLMEGIVASDIITEIPPVRGKEGTNYPTQKPEALLERVIKASSNEGDLVLDFFAGSGTTLAVAEKLGRRWIGCDLSRYAIQVTRKRMLDIEGCRPFQLLNLGRYERRHWQVNVLNGDKPPERAAAEYYRFIVALYQAEAVGGHVHLHGRKAGRYAHVGPADAPVTRDEVMSAVRECAANRIGGLDVLGWEWELGLHDTITDEAQAEGVNVRLLVIPREVMDRRAVEKGDVQFHELAYLKTSLETSGLHVVVRLDDFIIPNPELVPDEVRSRIKKWSDYIDFWAVDWNYGAAGEGDVFHNEWQTYRTRSAPALILLSEPHVYDAPGTRRILVKVIDIFGNDATQLREVELR